MLVKQLTISSTLLTVFVFGIVAFALAPALTLAAPPETTDGFVCPVFNANSQAGVSNPNAVQIGGGDFSVIGPNVSVPVHATNGNGAGSPGGSHSSPGDSDYTAIWSGQ